MPPPGDFPRNGSPSHRRVWSLQLRRLGLCMARELLREFGDANLQPSCLPKIIPATAFRQVTSLVAGWLRWIGLRVRLPAVLWR